MQKSGLLLLLYMVFSLSYGQAGETEFKVMFYNVENLFDIVDDPNTMDDEFTPGSEKMWDAGKYEKKLEDIAEVIQAVDRKELPVIIGLCEVENLKVVEDLVALRGLKKGHYGIVHYDSPDERGIDCALLYNRERFTVSGHRAIQVSFPFDSTLTTRDILHVEGSTPDGRKLHFFVNHWSSRREGERETRPRRMFCAVTLRKAVDDILNREPGAGIVIMGDFNDEPTNRSVFEMLLANNKRKNAGSRELYNLMYDLHNAGGEGTYNFRGNWNMLDQIIVSRSLLEDREGWHTGYDAGRILKEDFMLYYREEEKQEVPNRTYGGPRYYGGISDHLPVYFSLYKKGN
jgi:predicted extracellular nuclease